jgi:hypothetical protein
MNMQKPEYITQAIAVILIITAAVAIYVGESHSFMHLIDYANNWGGAGIGILTGSKIQSAMTKTGDINTGIPPAQPVV